MTTTPSVSRFPWSDHIAQASARTAERAHGRRLSAFSTDFEFLNNTFPRQHIGAPASFHLFPKLPLELREHIWELSLPQQRLLKVTVAAAELVYDSAHQSKGNASNDPNHAPYQSKNKIGNIISGADYHLRLGSTNTHSPLLHVNHEANALVHRVYRVHVPITQRVPTFDAPCLRFCPERDTILITVERDEDKAYFADFVHDALANDPMKKGILHIAIMDKPDCFHLPIGLPNLHSRAQAALASTLRGLESVSLVHLLYTESRQMFHSLCKYPIVYEIPSTDLARFNRAYPLWSSAASYSILPVDPRPVSRYLDLVDCGWDPRRVIHGWRMLEAAHHVLPTSPERIRVLIATTHWDEGLTIATTSQACSFRQQEEFTWTWDWAKEGLYSRNCPYMSNPDDNKDVEFSKTQNAIGFWSIPLEAFDLVLDLPPDFYQWDTSRVCNLGTFESQIELGLFTIT
ncbi:hypothetical protein K504DRAFT_539182 [Pleomassaria siparia CBS 279.74]|uniref:2EXR domain-containing protein n=1 Tax=Pleomassaria siparia CBS 279.74 TaxID=1314801 RepID=A0A6G1JQS5_9PLEO|nr:hypothetical protein K504DRAFT_539182 [Pleomassaria siparia CBS 279.74]